MLAYLEVALATLAPATASLLYLDFFTSRAYLPAVLAAAAGGAVVATVAAIRRWSTVVTVLLAVVGFVLLATFAVYTATLDHGVPTVRTAPALGSGLLHGWARMLSVSLPADVTADLLIMPTLLAWVAAVVSTTVLLRTRAPLAPTVPPLLVFVVGLLYTANRAGPNIVVTAALLLELLLLVAVRVARIDATSSVETTPIADIAPQGAAEPSTVDMSAAEPLLSVRRRRALGRLAFAVPVVLVVTALAVGGARLAPVASGTERFDPRDKLPLRYNINDTLTPLVTIKSQLREAPKRQLFTVRVEGDPGLTLDRVRTVALDKFDGALWTSDDTFLVAGRTLSPDPSLTDARHATIHVTIDDLPGPYLPVVGWPVRTNATGVGFSDTSGVLVTNLPSLHGMTYDVEGELRPKDSSLSSAVPSLTGHSGHYTQLPPGIPPEIEAKAAELTASAADPYAKLTAIEKFLRKQPYSLEARPGHSYDALRRLFSSNPQDRIGYAEQYASAFAVLARSEGFPTRVAVGYLLRQEARSGDAYAVSTADAHAWAEVDLEGHGWVTFDPTNFSQPVNPSQPPPTADPGDPGRANPDNPGQLPTVDPGLKAGPSTKAKVIAGTLIVLAILVAMLLLTPMMVAVEKFRRRRRRRRGSRARRIIGAWRDATDRLVERGVAVPRSLTAREVAVRAEQELGDPANAVAVMAPIVTAAVFSPAEPAEDTVREAWELSAKLRRDLRRGRGVLPAMRAWFDPRPLFAAPRDRRRRRRALERMQRG